MRIGNKKCKSALLQKESASWLVCSSLPLSTRTVMHGLKLVILVALREMCQLCGNINWRETFFSMKFDMALYSVCD